MTNRFPFASDEFFVLRAPALPFDILEGLSEGLFDPSQDPAQLEAVIERDKEVVRSRLREAVRRPEIREALLLASPDLEAQLDSWLHGGLPSEKGTRIERSLFRYLIRMAFRPTPFGLFSGCSLGRWGESTDLSVQGWRSATRHTRLDMGYLHSLVETIERDPDVRKALTYRPNASLYRAAGRLRYAEWRLDERGEREYHLVALEDDEYLSGTLNTAGSGASMEELASSLGKAGIPMEAAMDYVHELIDNQVLVSEIHPRVTGEQPIHGVIEKLKAEPGTAHLASCLERVRDVLAELDAGGIGQDPARYRALGQDLQTPTEGKVKTALQVDMGNVAPGAVIGPAVRKGVEKAVDLLRRLAPKDTRDPFKSFKAAFQERYESRWVPLLEVLDDEIGIGYNPDGETSDASPLMKGLPFPTGPGKGKDDWGDREAFLLRRLIQLQGQTEWELNAEDLKALENPEPDEVPDSFAAMAKVSAISREALGAGDFQIFLGYFYGPSGVKLLGRFCHLDPELESCVHRHLEAEAAFHPDAVFAEVVHLPEGRLGNMICRPQLRRHEIPYLGAGSAEGEHQLQPQDLVVSVVGGRVTLRSRSLGREVIPRLTSAHNYSMGLGVYRFLCRLQDQGSSGGGWSWGPLESSPFLPRVRQGKHILARARWRLEEDELRPVFAGGEKGWFKAFQGLRKVRGLPRYVVFSEADMELLVDLDNALWVESFLQYVAKRGLLTLEEWFPGPDAMFTQGPDGRFAHELLVPFLRVPQAAGESLPQQQVSMMATPALAMPTPRAFAPGSEWLYLKLYTGSATADQLLAREVQPFIEATRGIWDRWFFIRYSDPGDHIRLRFHGDPALLTGELLPRFQGAFGPNLETGHCWRIQVDTYQREAERYGGAIGIALAEDIFWADSEAVLDLLSAYPGDEGADAKWKLGLKSADMFLVDLGLAPEARGAFISEARQAYGREFQSMGSLDIELGKRFRGLRRDLDSLVFAPNQNQGGFMEGIGILNRRSQRLAPYIEALKEAEKEGRLTVPVLRMAGSFIHMALNRLFRSSQRHQEFVIYDFLNRLYQSRLARSRGGAGRSIEP